MQNILIMGAGISGLGAARVLSDQGCHVVLSDLHEIQDEKKRSTLESRGVQFSIGPQTTGLLDGIDTMVVSPVIPRENLLVQEAFSRHIPVISEIELAYRVAKAPILAVTGTNGKTTTTSLLGKILEKEGVPFAVAGNIGCSLSRVAETVPANGLIAAEVSSFQLEFVDSFKPAAAVILNITPDHMERHHSMEAYVAAKARIFENMGPENALLLNAEDTYTPKFINMTKAHVYLFSTEHPVDEGAWLTQEGMLQLCCDGKTIDIVNERELQIRGKHNMQNCLAAAFLAYRGGCSLDAIQDGLRDYHALEHRIEFVQTLHGVSYYNDSKATNTDAAEKALGAFHEPVILIAGGHDKDTPLDSFMQVVKAHVKHLILLGEAAERFKRAAQEAGITRLTVVGSMEEAVKTGAALADYGDVVLLSPACSSYDMYHSYEERGCDFKKIVQALE